MALENCVKYCYTWRIENYSMRYLKHKESFKSPIFTVNNCGAKWHLEFFPFGRKSKEFKSCLLCRSTEDIGADEVSIAIKFEIINSSGDILLARGNDSTKYKFKRGTQIGWDDIGLKCPKQNLGLRCRMYIFLPSSSEAVTKIEVDNCAFKWTVNYIECSTRRVSRIFSLSESLEYEIAVTSPNDEIEIEISKLGGCKVPTILCGNISLLNNQGEKDLSKTEKHTFNTSDEGNGVWHFPAFIVKDDLQEEDYDYLDNGTFTLFCEFSEANGKEHVLAANPTDNHFMAKLNNIVTLHSDLKNIFSSMKHSDVELRTENVTLPAHKAFLSARSPVFSAMFDQDMAENKSNVVDIPDVSAKTLKLFLEFLYTGSVKFQDCTSALKLLLMAEKYQVLTLKDTCSAYLIPVISVENVCEILSVADMVNLQQLKKHALDFIARHTTDIWMYSEWSEFIKNNVELSKEIFSYFGTHFTLTPKKN